MTSASYAATVELFKKLDEFAPADQHFWLNTFIEKLAPDQTCWLPLETPPSELFAALPKLRATLDSLLCAQEESQLQSVFYAELEEEQAFYQALAEAEPHRESERLAVDSQGATPLFNGLELEGLESAS